MIVMLNVLIAVVSDSYDKALMRATQVVLVVRFFLVVSVLFLFFLVILILTQTDVLKYCNFF